MNFEQLGRKEAQLNLENGTCLSKQELFRKVDEYKLGYLSVLCEYACNHIDPLFCLEQVKEIQAIYDFPFAQNVTSSFIRNLNNRINA